MKKICPQARYYPAVREGRDLLDIISLVRDYASLGGKKDVLLKQLQQLRDQFNGDDVREDLTLEVMDVVVGFVSPAMKVFE